MKLTVYLLVLAGFFIAACSQPIQQSKPTVTAIEELVEETADAPVETEVQPIKREPIAPLPPPDSQALLDEALEFCQAAKDYWQQSDFDSAISSLDRAYGLILSAEVDQESDLDQQKEDLRLLISQRLLAIYTSQLPAVKGRHHVIPLDMNPIVQKEIQRFQAGHRRFLTGSYRRSGRYRSFMVKALREAGLPEELSWLPLIESGFKARAYSPARALGLWQFIPTTGYRFGLKRSFWVDDRMNAEKSTRAALAYLQQLHRLFGDWATALAAYNCGESRVLRLIRRQNIDYLDHFWDLYEKLPKETRQYVPRFLAVQHILADPAKYGFALPKLDSPIETVSVTISKQVHLRVIAKEIGVTLDTLADLNPDLRRQVTPPEEFELRVPEGKGALLAKKLAALKVYQPPQKRFLIHTIRSGETLSHLAKIYRVKIKSIVRANKKIGRKTLLQIGQKVRIPAKGVVHHSRAKRAPARTRSYMVQAGDSPYAIAQAHDMQLERILRLNRLKPNSRIYPGQKLLVKDSGF